MTFNIRQLDNLTYDEAEPLLEDYIDDVIERIFPRKVTLLDASEADDAIPELVAFASNPKAKTQKVPNLLRKKVARRRKTKTEKIKKTNRKIDGIG